MIRRAAAIAIVVAARIASADDEAPADELVRRAAAAHDELRFDDALALLEEAWHRGESDAAQIRHIFERAGEAAGAMGDVDAAKLWFSRWLSVDPNATLAAGASPKLVTAFAEARRGLGGAAITARAVEHDGNLRVTLERDPLSLVTRARAGETVRKLEQGREVELPGTGDVELLDRDGNVLLEVAASQPITLPPQAPPAWYARWPVWTGATLGLLAVSGVSFAIAVRARDDWRDLNETSAQHDYSEVRGVERRFERALLVSRIAIAGAAITGVIGAIVVVRGRERPSVSLAPSTTGAVVVWSGDFW